MNKIRLISTVLIKQGYVVQSFGFKSFLPVGLPDISVENLARWNSDEVLVLDIDKSKVKTKPDYKLIQKISQKKLSTPLIYGGGISTYQDAYNCIKFGVDRIVIGYNFWKNMNYELLQETSLTLGSQAVILSLPILKLKNSIFIYDFVNKKNIPLKNMCFKKLKNYVSEILITDVKNEGKDNGFDLSIADKLKDISIPLIYFGGLNAPKKIKKLKRIKNTTGIALGNFLNYFEHAYQDKLNMNENIFSRAPYYEKK